MYCQMPYVQCTILTHTCPCTCIIYTVHEVNYLRTCVHVHETLIKQDTHEHNYLHITTFNPPTCTQTKQSEWLTAKIYNIIIFCKTCTYVHLAASKIHCIYKYIRKCKYTYVCTPILTLQHLLTCLRILMERMEISRSMRSPQTLSMPSALCFPFSVAMCFMTRWLATKTCKR